MDFKSLNKKNNGEKVRLTEPSVLFNVIQPDRFIQHVVKEDEIGRPDLIANQYGGINLTDHILKINNISNPFSINEGDILIIPDDLGENMLKWVRISTENIDDNPIRKQFLETKKTSQIDQRRVNFIQNKIMQKKGMVNQQLPPNILENGESNVSTSNSNSIF